MDGHEDRRSLGGGTPAIGDEECAQFVAGLLARCEGGGAAVGHLLPPLRGALMHCTELHAMRRRKGPSGPLGHRVVKHVFLLSDGGSATLWEVEHDGHPDGRVRHRLLPDRARAEEFARERFGEPPLLDLWPQPGEEPEAPARPVTGPGLLGPALDGLFGTAAAADPLQDPDFTAGTAGALDPRGDGGSELARMIAEIFFTARHAEQHRPRGPRTARLGESADHARRVLRRAENADRPGEAVGRRLRAAVGHETILVTRDHDAAPGRVLEWALYQHAFLLADGAELSLWEIEHTLGPGAGEPVCEVFLDEAAARDCVDRHRGTTGG
jgi:hypothetical protein